MAWGIRKFRRLSGLHIYNTGKGYVVLEKAEDFDVVITKKLRLEETTREAIDHLQYDKMNPLYKAKVTIFFGKKKITSEEFNKMAKTELLRSRVRKKDKKALK